MIFGFVIESNKISFVLKNISLVFLQFFKSKEDKSIASNSEQDENIFSIFTTLLVLKLDKLSFFIEEHFSNISFIYSTFSVLKEFISSSFKLFISLNIPDIFFTLDVSNFDKFSDVIFEHPENISFINSTFLVDNPSTNVLFSKFEQPSNICDISLTFSVEKFFISILSKFEHPLNIFDAFVILYESILSN